MNDATVERVSGKINPILSEFRDTTICCLEKNKAVRAKADKKLARDFVCENIDAMILSGLGLDFILPEGTRFFCPIPRKNSLLFVIEQEPIVRTLNFSEEFLEFDMEMCEEIHKIHYRDKDGSSFKRHEVQLAFPYVIFLIEIPLDEKDYSKQHAYCSNNPLNFKNDLLYQLHLPNLSHGHRVCMGFEGFKSEDDTIPKKIVKIINHFWGSSFNGDYYGSCYGSMQAKNKKFANVWEWEKNSLKDPSFVLNADWGYSRTLEEAICSFTCSNPLSESIDFYSFLNKITRQYSEHTCNVIGDSCLGLEIPKIVFPKSVINDVWACVDEEKKRIESFKGLVRGARVCIRKDSRYYSEAPGIVGVITRDFGYDGKTIKGEPYAKVKFDNGSINTYRQKDLDLAVDDEKMKK